ncbi:hexokinase-2 [Diutina catenulata]
MSEDAYSVTGLSTSFAAKMDEYTELLTVSPRKLQEISAHFEKELEKGLSKAGGNIPMNPTWVLDYPTGNEKGEYLALDLGGTNMRVVLVTLDGNHGFTTDQEKFALPDDIRTTTADKLWEFVASGLDKFVKHRYPDGVASPLPLGFTFSYPATQHSVNAGILQRWTKGWDIDGVEGHDVVPMLNKEMAARNIPVEVVALINDTTGTMVASAYTDPETKMGLIYGTGCNGAYYEVCGDIPKLEGKLPADLKPDTPMAINCEYGAFDNEHAVLPRTRIDKQIDADSPRPGQQAFEKMISGYYLGEVLRLILLELHGEGHLFADQDVAQLQKPFVMDASYPSRIEEDPYEHLAETEKLLQGLGLSTSLPERQAIRRLSQLIGIRSARLSVCGIAAACTKRGYKSGHCAADGSLYNKYPRFAERAARGLRDIFEWADDIEDPITIVHAQDGSGVGAAVIAALTQQRLDRGQSVGEKE